MARARGHRVRASGKALAGDHGDPERPESGAEDQQRLPDPARSIAFRRAREQMRGRRQSSGERDQQREAEDQRRAGQLEARGAGPEAEAPAQDAPTVHGDQREDADGAGHGRRR